MKRTRETTTNYHGEADTIRSRLREMMVERTPFAFVRFGDGEFENMNPRTQETRGNCDGNHYFTEQGVRLVDALHYFCTQKKGVFVGLWATKYGEGEMKMLESKFPCVADATIVYFDSLHCNYDPRLGESRINELTVSFYKTMRRADAIRKIFVGCRDAKCVANFIGATEHVVIPDTDCFVCIAKIIDNINKCANDGDVIVFSAGMATKIMIHELHAQNSARTYIDIGSSLDYFYKRSRDTHSFPEYHDMFWGHFSERHLCFSCDGPGLHGGYADRLKGALTTAFLAKVTGRSLTIKWTTPAPVSDFFDGTALNKSMDLVEETTIHYDDPSHSVHSLSDIIQLLRSNVKVALLVCNQFVVRELLKLPQIHEALKGTTLENVDQEDIFRMLFRETFGMCKIELHPERVENSVGVQIRTGGDQTEWTDPVFAFPTPSSVREHIEKFVGCETSVFVCSDSQEWKRKFIETCRNTAIRVEESGIENIVHIERSDREKAKQGMRDTIYEHMMLSACRNGMFIGGGEFGKTAAWIGGICPAVVTSTSLCAKQFLTKELNVGRYHVFGDSHALFCFAGMENCTNHGRPSITMHRIGRRDEEDNIIFRNANVDAHDIVFLLFGEIDCRCHIDAQPGDTQSVISDLVKRYFISIDQNITAACRVVICAVPPPVRKCDYDLSNGPLVNDFPFPFKGTDERRVFLTRMLNKELERECDKHERFLWFDFTRPYTRTDGTLKFEECSDRVCHIKTNEEILKMAYEIPMIESGRR